MDIKETIEHFKDKTVLITGHTGFKGAWLTYLLAKHGANVVGLALEPNTTPNLFDDLNLDKKCKSTIGDVRDAALVSEIVINTQPDFIFHMAAQPLVRYSYKNPIETFSTNVMGTANVLDACRQLTKKCCVVCITTDKVYANNEWVYPYRETDALGGHDPYSASKAASELVIDSYRKSYFLNSNILVASARAGNVIGGGDWSEDRLIPDIIRSIRANSKIILRNPDAIRPWQHVLDPLFGYLLLALNLNKSGLNYCEAWNFGPKSDDIITVQGLTNTIISKLGNGDVVYEKFKDQPHESKLLKLDISKTQNVLKWSNLIDVYSAVKLTAKWYKNYYASAKTPEELIQDDFDFYMKIK